MAAKKGAVDLVAGTLSGVLGTVVGHPLDTIKVRLQTQARDGSMGALSCARQIYRQEGLASFFKGLSSPLASLTFLNMMSFTVYGQLNLLLAKALLPWADTPYRRPLRTSSFFVAGAGVGAVAGLFSTPFEMVKVRMQLDSASGRVPRFTGSWHCARTLAREQGIRVLYTGFSVNFVREMTFCAAYFGTYELAKRALLGSSILFPLNNSSSAPLSSHSRAGIATTTEATLAQAVVGPKDHSLGSLAAVQLAGGLAGMVGWLCSYPLDVVKSLVQSETGDRRRGFFQHVRARWSSHGLAGFFSGIRPTLLRAFIVSGVRFSIYEAVVLALTPADTTLHDR
jgi:solute carrier family 25 carnitine/acylcarnitine transporter 20/29